jgi:hypothetical protein
MVPMADALTCRMVSGKILCSQKVGWKFIQINAYHAHRGYVIAEEIYGLSLSFASLTNLGDIRGFSPVSSKIHVNRGTAR